MSDRRRSVTASALTPVVQSIVGSAVVLDAKIDRLPKQEGWVDEAWHYYDAVPEVRFCCSWYGNALSRMRLIAAKPGEAGDPPTPIESGPAFDLMEAFGGGSDGQAALLGAAAVQFTVPGVGYVVGEQSVAGGPKWQVLSADEIRQKDVKGGRIYEIQTGDGNSDWRPAEPEMVACRFWRPHHRYHFKPDSPIRGSFSVLREMELVTQHIEASGVSRLAGAGLLILPQEITVPVDEKYADAVDPFMAMLTDAMLVAIRDRNSAAAVAPIVIRIPGDYVDKVRHLLFSTPFDERALELRDAGLNRFATGMDMPAEILKGMGDVNHWGQWQIGESALTLHLEPMTVAFCKAVTDGYLRPALAAIGQPDDEVVCWYDATELQVRPDRSADAKDAYHDGVIGAVPYRRETGFSEEDAPTDDETRRKVLLDVLASVPEMAPLVLAALGIDVKIPDNVEPLGGTPPPPVQVLPPANPAALPPGAPGPPETPSGPTGGAPEAALAAAANEIVFRALERAGARMVNTARKQGLAISEGTPNERLHTLLPEGLRVDLDALLDGAWERVPEVATRYGCEPAALRAALEDYTTSLIAGGWAHDFNRLSEVLGAV